MRGPGAAHHRGAHEWCGSGTGWRGWAWLGVEAAGTGRLLILTQVVLSLQLSFAVIPLVLFTASRARMGALVAPLWLGALAWGVAGAIVTLNLKLLWDFFGA